MSQTTPYSYTIHSVGASGMTVELRYDGEQFDVFSLLPPPSDYTQVPVLWPIHDMARIAAGLGCLVHHAGRIKGPLLDGLAKAQPRPIEIDGRPVSYDF